MPRIMLAASLLTLALLSPSAAAGSRPQPAGSAGKVLRAGAAARSTRSAGAVRGVNSTGYDGLLRAVIDLLEAGKPDAAFQKTAEAIKRAPDRPEAYFYGGMALYREDLLDASGKYFGLALARIGGSRTPGVTRELVVNAQRALADKREFEVHRKAGEAAEAAGTAARAVAEYEAAWKLFPSRGDVGLKAARLCIEPLKDLPRAATFLRSVTTEASDPEAGADASRLLAEILPTLRSDYLERVNAASRLIEAGSEEQGVRDLEAAIVFLPEGHEAHVVLARLHARRGQISALGKELALVVKQGKLTLEGLGSYPEFLNLFDSMELGARLADIFGPDAPARARTLLADHKAAEAERERLAREASERAAREEQARREKARADEQARQEQARAQQQAEVMRLEAALTQRQAELTRAQGLLEQAQDKAAAAQQQLTSLEANKTRLERLLRQKEREIAGTENLVNGSNLGRTLYGQKLQRLNQEADDLSDRIDEAEEKVEAQQQEVRSTNELVASRTRLVEAAEDRQQRARAELQQARAGAR